MDRAVPAIVAVLIVASSAGAVIAVSPPAGATAARTPVDGVSSNTTDVLVLDEIEASAFARGDLVVTGALDVQTTMVVERYARERLAATLAAADSAAARRAALRNATARADRQTAQLLATERDVRMAYIAGNATAETYLSTLGRLHAEATALEETVRAIAAVEGVSPDRLRTERLRANLQMLQGPVRERLAASLGGSGPSIRVFVAASRQGVTLSFVSNGAYVRETVRFDNRDDAVGTLPFDEAETRFGELYPWASAHKQRISMGALGADVYVVEYTHPHGTVDAWLDASTRHVFREIQHKTLSALPVGAVRLTRAENVTVGISNTYPGGPLRVNVSNATGAPVAGARVSINGTQVGTTGEEGIVWAVSPAGEYPVTVSTDGLRVQVMVDPSTDVVRMVESPPETTTTG